MDIKDIVYLRKYFKEYAGGFYSEDSYVNKNVKIKEEHTLRVSKHIVRICASLDLKEAEVHLAEAVALCHDIGRFEQLKRYRTFNDKKSANHAELGVEVMARKKMLISLQPGEQEIITKAVKFHNRKDLPAGESEGVIFFLKLIRDADKLDILEVLTNYYSSPEYGSNPALELDLPDTQELSKEVVAELLDNKPVNAENLRSPGDFKILQLSWVFDLNFAFSLKYVNEHNFVDKIAAALCTHRTPEIESIRRHVQAHLSSRLFPGKPV
jgi:hypothetical protein